MVMVESLFQINQALPESQSQQILEPLQFNESETSLRGYYILVLSQTEKRGINLLY